MKKALSILVLLGTVTLSGANDHWVGTWATAVVVRPQGPPAAAAAAAPAGSACAPAANFGPPPGGGRANAPAPPPPINFKNQTLREIVHTSLGGDRVRIVLSNAFGTLPLEVGAAHVALR